MSAFRDYRAEAEALPLVKLAGDLEQAAQVLEDHAHDCRGSDCEASYRLESAAVLRAARIIRALSEGGVL